MSACLWPLGTQLACPFGPPFELHLRVLVAGFGEVEEAQHSHG